MPYYQYLRDLTADEQIRTADGLLRLKEALSEEVPPKTTSGNLLIATWNIREFDSNDYGRRLEEAIYYIAEIIDHFDLVAVQEVNENLDGIYRVKKVLGYAWDMVFSDVTAGSSGNKERLAFLFDTRKLSLTGLSGEIVIPPMVVPEADGEQRIYEPSTQLARTPLIIGLRTSWFKFSIATVHIIYGSGVHDEPRRVQEIRFLSDFLAARTEERYSDSRNLILLGDFNIFKPNNETFQEITRNFYIPEALQNLPSNVKQNKFYDQIAFRGDVPADEIQGGVFNFYEHVFRPEDEAAYAPYMPDTYHKKDEPDKKSRYYQVYWRTHQLSDHLPMWVELKIDFSKAYLNKLKNGLADTDVPGLQDGE